MLILCVNLCDYCRYLQRPTREKEREHERLLKGEARAREEYVSTHEFSAWLKTGT